MKLPNGINVAIPTEKVEQYLLSDIHAVGRAKARFFRGVGYGQEDPSVLKADLASIARNEQVPEVIQTRHGTKYILDGRVKTPSGSSVRIRTVWIVEPGSDRPRLVTAYPA